jgi:hypothetical protein
LRRTGSTGRHLDQRATFKLGVLSIRIESVQIGVLCTGAACCTKIEYLVKGFLRVVLESNVMPSILGDQLSKSHELAPKK